MSRSKEVLTIVWDVSNSAEAPKERFLVAQQAVRTLLRQKILFSKRDEFSVLIVGSEKTENDMNEESGGYENCESLTKLSAQDVSALRLVDEYGPSSACGDVIDGLVIATTTIHDHVGKKKASKRICLVTAAESIIDVDEEQLDKIIKHLNIEQVKLDIIVVGYGTGEEGSLKAKQEAILQDISTRVEGGVLYPCKHAMETLNSLRSISVIPTTVFRGALEISEDCGIGVWAYLKTKRAVAPSLKKRKIASDSNLNMQRSYFVEDGESAVKVDSDDTVKGFPYGKGYIPVSKDDEIAMKLETTKRLQLIGFLDKNLIPRHYHMDSPVLMVPQPDDEKSQVGMSALAHALADTNRVAWVRLVKRKNATPQIGMLAPYFETEGDGELVMRECLLFVVLPYADDIRSYPFGNLDEVATPSPDQLSAAEALVRSLDLMTAETTDSGEKVPALQTELMFSPKLQHLYQCLEARAMDKNAPLPSLLPEVAQYLLPNKGLFEAAQPQLAAFKEAFPLVKVDKSQKKRQWGGAVEDEEEEEAVAEPEIKRRRVGELGAVAATHIGSVNPIEDYKSMIKQTGVDLSMPAFTQMQTVIANFKDANLVEKCCECISAIRDGCCKLGMAQNFNDYLNSLKQEVGPGGSAGGADGSDLWARMVTGRLSLIPDPFNQVAKKDCDAFLSDPVAAPDAVPSTVPVEESVEAVDSDFSEMD